jgi:hypothetical protein
LRYGASQALRTGKKLSHKVKKEVEDIENRSEKALRTGKYTMRRRFFS